MTTTLEKLVVGLALHGLMAGSTPAWAQSRQSYTPHIPSCSENIVNGVEIEGTDYCTDDYAILYFRGGQALANSGTVEGLDALMDVKKNHAPAYKSAVRKAKVIAAERRRLEQQQAAAEGRPRPRGRRPSYLKPATAPSEGASRPYLPSASAEDSASSEERNSAKKWIGGILVGVGTLATIVGTVVALDDQKSPTCSNAAPLEECHGSEEIGVYVAGAGVVALGAGLYLVW